MAIAEEGEYRGNAMIVLKRAADDKYPFSFGLSKAKLVVDAVEDIKKWIAKQEASKPAAGGPPED